VQLAWALRRVVAGRPGRTFTMGAPPPWLRPIAAGMVLGTRRITAQPATSGTRNVRVAAQKDSIYLIKAGMRYGRNFGGEIQAARQPPAAQGQFTVFCIQVKQGPNSRLASDASVAKRTGDALCVSCLTTELPIAETQSAVSAASALGTESATARR